MKIQDLATNDSSFIELDLNEAADVCRGGSGWYPMEFHDNLEEEFGTSSLSTIYARQYQNRYAQTQPRFNSSDLDGINRYVNGSLAPLRMNGINI
ncbi:MAG: hypothetical protein RLZZ04_3784 [Cyanobacteriota bacterium]|jgi:hypothetical protein